MRPISPATVLMVLILAACGRAATAGPARDAPRPVPPPSYTPRHRQIEVCVIHRGELRKVNAMFDIVTGDTAFDEREWGYAAPLQHAADSAWFVRNEPLVVGRERYVKYGASRRMQPADQVLAGEYRGVPLFAERGAASPPALVYVPVRYGCAMQPYGRLAGVVISDSPWRPMRVCVADANGMREVRAQYNTLNGDTLVDGRPFTEVHPTTAQYAAGAEWFINNEPIEIDGITCGKYGLPRETRPGTLVRRQDYRGVMMFTEVDDAGNPYDVWYAAVRTECVFQPYQWDLLVGIRG